MAASTLRPVFRQAMSARRYTVVIADRSSGVMRRATVSLSATAVAVTAVLALPILMGLGAKWSARTEIDQLRGANSLLQVENGSYRLATGELTSQIQSLESVINDLGARASLDPAQARAMQKLPAVVKTRSADGVIESASYTGDYGNLIVIKHGFGLATRYGHLSALAVKPGSSVKRGDVVGYVGSTGRPTGVHLHYEILANGQLINPLQLLTQPARR